MRIRHTDGPGTYNHGSFDGISHRGDEHDVSEAAAEYLCDKLGYFERTGEITLTEDEYTVEDSSKSLGDYTYDELYALATDAEISGRSDMSKDELIEALSE